MTDETSHIERNSDRPGSKILNVSIRGWAGMMVVVTYCTMAFMGRDLTHITPAAMMVLGAMFNQALNSKK